MKKRNFLFRLFGIVLCFFGACRNVFGRWWHGTPGDINWLASHMMGPKHRIPRSQLVGMSYQKMEAWHEYDHQRYGDTPSRYRIYRPKQRYINTPKQKRKRCYVINNRLVFK